MAIEKFHGISPSQETNTPKANEMVKLAIKESLLDLSDYENRIGWKFDGSDGIGAVETIKEYAKVVIDNINLKGDDIGTKKEILSDILTIDGAEFIARTICSRPTLLFELPAQVISNLKTYKPNDLSLIHLYFNSKKSYDDLVTLSGGYMSMKLNIANDVATLDFVPSISIYGGSNNPFASSNNIEISDSQKNTAKLDLIKILNVLVQGYSFSNKDFILVDADYKTEKVQTRGLLPIQHFDILKTSRTNEIFAKYLHNKFNFNIEKTGAGWFASIKMVDLCNQISTINDLEQKYLEKEKENNKQEV